MKYVLCRIAVMAVLLIGAGHDGHAALNCNVELGASAGLSLSGYRLNRRVDRFVQTVQITNNSKSVVDGPIYLVLDNLGPGVALANASGTADCSGVASSASYVQLDAGPDNLFSPGETARVVLQFQNPSRVPIRYTPRVFGGSAAGAPLAGVSVDPDGFPVNTPTQVTFTAAVPYPPGGIVPTVQLEQVDENGIVIDIEGSMLDNGQLSLGDELGGDGVFSFRKTYSVTHARDIHLRVRADFGGESRFSEVFDLIAFNPISDADVEAMNNAQTDAAQLYFQLLATKGKEQASADVVSFLKGRSIVQDAGVSGNTIWIKYTNGITGALLLNPPGSQGGELLPVAAKNTTLVSAGVAASLAAKGNIEVASKRVLLLAPFHDEFGISDNGPVTKGIFDNHNAAGGGCPSYDITYLENTSAGVGAFKTVGGFGVVHVNSHGGVLAGKVIVATRTLASATNMNTYLSDLNSKPPRLVTGNAGGKNVLIVTPDFFSYYVKSMPSSLVFISACESANNSTLSDVLLKKGAKTYLGFSGNVKTGFSLDRAKHFYEKWVDDPSSLVTTGEIFSNTCSAGACWVMSGATNLEAPAGDQIQNGGFESGTLGAWTAQGDGRVLSQLGTFSPTEGNFAGLISTGLGFTADSGSIEQKACIPATAKTLTFDWNFSSEEFREWCGSGYQDYFRVDLVTASGATTNVFFQNVDSVCGATSKVPFSFDQGDVWSTGWNSQSIDISGFAAANAGKSVSVRFSAGDVGDSAYDSAILLDKIEIK